MFLALLKVSQTVAGIFCDKIAFLFGIGFLEYELRIGPLYKIQGPDNISLGIAFVNVLGSWFSKLRVNNIIYNYYYSF